MNDHVQCDYVYNTTNRCAADDYPCEYRTRTIHDHTSVWMKYNPNGEGCWVRTLQEEYMEEDCEWLSKMIPLPCYFTPLIRGYAIHQRMCDHKILRMSDPIEWLQSSIVKMFMKSDTLRRWVIRNYGKAHMFFGMNRLYTMMCWKLGSYCGEDIRHLYMKCPKDCKEMYIVTKLVPMLLSAGIFQWRV